MQSLKELYKIGCGPSSSHTIGPERACAFFSQKHRNADRFEAILYKSLAKTGKGHCTDYVIKKTFSPTFCDVVFDTEYDGVSHPNTFDLIAYAGDRALERIRVISVGGGSVVIEGEPTFELPHSYRENRFDEIAELCRERDIRLWEYVLENEDADFLS